MVCNAGKITKKKVVVLSSIGLAVTAVTYVGFTLTHNPLTVAAIPSVLALAACPAMCIGMGGIFYVANRLGRGKSRNKHLAQLSREVECKKKASAGACTCDIHSKEENTKGS